MSTLPEVTINVLDNGLGIIPSTNGNSELTIGVASGAVPNTLYSFGDLSTLQSVLGYGPGVDALAMKLALGGGLGSQYFVMPPLSSNSAISSSISHVGIGTGALANTIAPLATITVRTVTTGAPGTGRVTYQIGSGPISSPIVLPASGVAFSIPGTQTQITFTGAFATTIGDLFIFYPTGSIGHSGIAHAQSDYYNNGGVVSQVSQITDTYPVTATVVNTGGFQCVPGATTSGSSSVTGSISYGLDQNPVTNASYSLGAPVLIPGFQATSTALTAGKSSYAIPRTGLSLAFTQPAIVATISTPGALGTMQFTYTVDGGGSLGPITTSVGAANVIALPGTGISLTFPPYTYTNAVTYTWTSTAQFTLGGGGVAADNVVSLSSAAFVIGDVYSFQTIAPGYSAGDLGTTLQAILAGSINFSFLHVVGTPASANAAESVAASVDAQLVTAASNFKYLRAQVECPTLGSIILSGGNATVDSADTDVAVSNAFNVTQQFLSRRVGVGAGDAIMSSPVTGLFLRRNAAYIACARVALVVISEDLAYVGRGALPLVTYLFRDEAKTPFLDAARFTTLRTFQGLVGYFITNGRLMAEPTSDFSLIQYGRVMDAGCSIARAALLPYLSAKERIKPVTGFINELDAQAIEGVVTAAMVNGLVSPGDASDVLVSLSRTTNIAATGSEPVLIQITALGYLKNIEANIGFVA